MPSITAIPTYLSQRQNAFDADAKTLSNSAAVAAFSYRAKYDSYTGMDATELHDLEGSLPDPADADFPAPYGTYDITVVGPNDFRIDVKHSGGATTFRSTDSGTTLPLP